MKRNRSTLRQWTIPALKQFNSFATCSFVDKNVLEYHLEFPFKDIYQQDKDCCGHSADRQDFTLVYQHRLALF